MASAVLDLVVPGAGSAVSVLAAILQLCDEMKESQQACKRVHRRLEDIFSELQKLQHSNQLPSKEAIGKYVEMLQNYLEYLGRYRGKPLYLRLLQHQKMMEEIRQLNEEIDTLMKVLNVATTGAMMHWKQQWEEDHEAQTGLLTSIADNSEMVLSEVRSMHEQLEALTVIKFELQEARLSQEAMRPMKKMFDVIVRASCAAVPAVPVWFIPVHDVEYDAKAFARGSFGALHHGKWGSGARVVVKTLVVDDEQARAQFEKEIDLWYKLRHPNVVKMFGACHLASPPFIVCEEATNGSLAEYLSRSRGHMWRLLHEAALGLEYLHSHHIVHGDLKLNNLLVGADGAARVADFGLSEVIGSGGGGSARGGLQWRAPECLEGAETFQSDVYSFAMCIIEAVVGGSPFGYADDENVRLMIKAGTIPTRPVEMFDDAWNLVLTMTSLDPSKRPTMPSVIAVLKTFVIEELPAPPMPKGVLAGANGATVVVDDKELSSLIDALHSESEQATYSALKSLFRKADDDATSAAIKRLDGYRWLVHCFNKPQTSYGHKIYAMGALNRMLLSGALTGAEYNNLGLREPTETECTELVEALKLNDEEAVVEALEKLRWIKLATASVERLLPPLVELLRVGTVKQVEEATRTLRCFCLKKDEAILAVTLGVIPLLVNQLEVGSTRQKDQTSLTLGFISKYDHRAVTPQVIRHLLYLIRDGDEKLKVPASAAIERAAANKDTSSAIIDAQVFEPLLELVRSGTDTQRWVACDALQQLASSDTHCRLIEAAGGIDTMIELTRSGTPQQQLSTLNALCRFSWNSPSRAEAIARRSGIRIAVDFVRTGDSQLKMMALQLLAQFPCVESRKAAIVDAGAVGPIVAILRDEVGLLKKRAANALAYITRNHDANCRAFANGGSIPPLVAMVRNGSEEEMEQASVALEALARHKPNKKLIEDAGGVAALVDLAGKTSSKLKALALVALKTLGDADAMARAEREIPSVVEQLRGDDDNLRRDATHLMIELSDLSDSIRETLVSAGAIPALAERLHNGQDEEKLFATAALYGLVTNRRKWCQSVVDAGAVAPLIEMLYHGNEQGSRGAARILAETASAIECYRSTVAEAVAQFVNQLKDPSSEKREAAAATLCCIAAGGDSNCDEILHAGALGSLMVMVRSGTDKEKQEAADTIGALALNETACRLVAEDGGVATFVELARSGTPEQKSSAVFVLKNLARRSHVRAGAITSAGGLKIVVELVRGEHYECKRNGLLALQALAQDSTTKTAITAAGVVAPIVETLREGARDLKEYAAVALVSLADEHDANCRVFAGAGAIPALVSMIRDDNDEEKKEAAGALATLAQLHTNRQLIVNAGAVPDLIELTASNDHRLKAQAAVALHAIGSGSEAVARVEQEIPRFVEETRGQDDALQAKAGFALWKLSDLSPTNRGAIVASGAIPILVELLYKGSSAQKQRAVGILRRLATAHGSAIAETSATGPLLELLRNGDDEVSVDAVAVLGEIALASDESCSVITEAGTVKVLLEQLRIGSAHQKKFAARALGNVAARNDTYNREVSGSGAIALLGELIASGTDAQKENATGALAVLATLESNCQSIANVVAISTLMQLLTQGGDELSQHVLRICRQLATADDSYGERLANGGAVPLFAKILQSGPRGHRDDAAYLLGCVARRSPATRSALVKLSLEAPLVEMAREGESAAKADAAFALGSMMKAAAAQREVRRLGGMDALRSLARTGTPEQALAAKRALSIGSRCRIS